MSLPEAASSGIRALPQKLYFNASLALRPFTARAM